MDVFVKCLAKKPGTECGDAFWYHEEQNVLWVLVVDGLGSGSEAAVAARAAVVCVKRMVMHPPATESDPHHLMHNMVYQTDQELRGTRGAAMGLLRVEARKHQGTFAGVGNVEARVLGETCHHPVCTPGIVGAGPARVRPESFPYRAGDLLVMHSDGVSSRFQMDPQEAAVRTLESLGERLVSEHGKSTDDLTLLLIRQHA